MRQTIKPRNCVCIDCGYGFTQTSKGPLRRWCDVCVRKRQRNRKIKMRFSHLERHLRPMVKAIVVEVLSDFDILPKTNGATKARFRGIKPDQNP